MAEVFYFHVQEDRSIKYKLLEPIMQEDKDVAVWRFRIPKVLNNIDMSAWAWWFVYVNAKGQKFSELLTLGNDIDDPDNYCTADYPIGYGISKTPGGFTFALEAINAEQGGEISGEWHTRTYTHTVTPTLQGNQAEYAETESDIISTLMQEVRTRMNQVIGGATPLPVNLKSQMTDHDKVYLYTGSEDGEQTGYWYYWNGTNFVPGGLYGAGIQIDSTLSQSGQAADAKATGDAINEVKADLSVISGTGTNLFDKDNVNYLNAYFYGSQGGNGTLLANDNARTVFIPCEPNTTYTVSKQSASARFSLSYAEETPAVGVYVYGLITYSGNTAITITTGENAKYLCAFIYLSTADTGTTFEQICAGLQIQTGSTATEYEPYTKSAVDKVARALISAIEALDALDGIFPYVQVTAIPQTANLGSALSFDISTMTGSGNATFENGAWHVSGGGAISGSISGIVANKTYLIELDISNVWCVNGDINTNPATITLGDKSLSIFSAADANWNVALAPTTSGTVTLACVFHENWNGVINGITVKPVNALASTPQKINNIPIRTNYANASVGGHEKLLLSTNCGKLNVSIGINSQRDINTGMWNSALGCNSQLKLTQGKGNNAFGCFTQNLLETGCYNNAFGESAQNHLVDGQWNDGFGIEAQGMATSAKNNVAFGRRSQHLLQTGNFNTAVGAWSGFNSHDVSPDGKNAVKTSSFTTLIGGGSTLKSPDTGDSDYATAVGFQTKVDKQGVAIGALAEADEGGIAIGYNAKAGAGEVVIGNKKIIFNLDGSVSWETVT